MANRNAGKIKNPSTDRISLADLQVTGGTRQIRDTSPTLWFPPGPPVNPVAPTGTPPRRFAGIPFININFSGRDGQIDFGVIRAFSYYPLVRFIIETIKDKISTTPWDIQVQMKPGETKQIYNGRVSQDPRVTK